MFMSVDVLITDLRDWGQHTLSSLALQLRDNTCLSLPKADNFKGEEAVAKSPLYALSSMLVT